MKGSHLMEIKAAALKSLTAIIHLDRNPNFPKLSTIIDVTGAASYHGFLPVLVRSCITSLTSAGNESLQAQLSQHPLIAFPQPLATALFSFLYHLASYEAGGEALVSCGMMESLLKVIQWPSTELDHITFVTRAVRVIDLITNLDMQVTFRNLGVKNFNISKVFILIVNSQYHQVLLKLQFDCINYFSFVMVIQFFFVASCFPLKFYFFIVFRASKLIPASLRSSLVSSWKWNIAESSSPFRSRLDLREEIHWQTPSNSDKLKKTPFMLEELQASCLMKL
jgi:hypothetical protein